MLRQPLDAFHEHHVVVEALLGLAALGDMVEVLAVPTGHAPVNPESEDHLIDMLLGFACLGRMVRRLVDHDGPVSESAPAAAPTFGLPGAVWLR
jgi:hypothetical protein